MKNFRCVATTVHDWPEALAIRAGLGPRYFFRGQSASHWTLTTRLERDLDLLGLHPAARKLSENDILDRFRRRARFYTGFELTDNLEWLALLQHHGGPTRLLDVTHSFFVAAFFAIDGAREDVAIWAFHRTGTVLGSDEALGEDFGRLANPELRIETCKYANRVLAQESLWKIAEFTGPREFDYSNAPQAVLIVEPEALFDRLAVQQGLFLFPVNLQTSFERNLASTFGWDKIVPQELKVDEFLEAIHHGQQSEVGVAKVTIKPTTFPEMAKDLYAMNVTAASIYPGLDGFAKSLSPLFSPDRLDLRDFRAV
jgi:hypothetical protein